MIIFRIAPTINAVKSIMPVALSVSTMPNSFMNTEKVATQGKYIDKTALAMINCFNVRLSGTSIPTAISFLKNPKSRAIVASAGRERT